MKTMRRAHVWLEEGPISDLRGMTVEVEAGQKQAHNFGVTNNKSRGGSDVTTSSSLMMSFDDFIPSKRPYSSLENNMERTDTTSHRDA